MRDPSHMVESQAVELLSKLYVLRGATSPSSRSDKTCLLESTLIG